VFSRILDFNDRTTCVLFGDGAGAVVLEASDTPGILATDLHADGKHVGILCVPGTVSGGRFWAIRCSRWTGRPFSSWPWVCSKAAACAGQGQFAGFSDIDWLIPHQANIRIMQSTAKKLKLPMDKVVVTVDQHGNTSAASIPLGTGCRRARTGRSSKGQTLMLEGVGGGFTWGAVLLKY
jgi:3-oxoacyl-[acyl-carrier-protein] synthase-3